MKDTALFTHLLGLSAPWRIMAITPDLIDKSMTIQIDWPKGTKGACSTCNALCAVYDHREQRTWRHLDTMQFKTRLVAQVPRIHCKEHGIKSLKVLMADTQARFTPLCDSLLMCCRLVATKHKPQNYLDCRGMRRIIFSPER